MGRSKRREPATWPSKQQQFLRRLPLGLSCMPVPKLRPAPEICSNSCDLVTLPLPIIRKLWGYLDCNRSRALYLLRASIQLPAPLPPLPRQFRWLPVCRYVRPLPLLPRRHWTQLPQSYCCSRSPTDRALPAAAVQAPSYFRCARRSSVRLLPARIRHPGCTPSPVPQKQSRSWSRSRIL